MVLCACLSPWNMMVLAVMPTLSVCSRHSEFHVFSLVPGNKKRRELQYLFTLKINTSEINFGSSGKNDNYRKDDDTM